MSKMTEQEFEENLAEMFETFSYMEEDEECAIDALLGNRSISFESKGVLTMNKGLVVRLKTGEEFQITIVRSK